MPSEADAATLAGAPVRERFRAGLKAGAPFAVAGLLVSLSFGVLAREAGFTAFEAILMSMIVFAGSAQFAAIAILSTGGTAAAAMGAAALMNSRFLPMGAALGPSLPGGPVKRALQGQPVVDASWVIASRGDGTFDRWLLFGSTAIQYVTWTAGTAIGAFGGDAIGDPDKFGLDAVFPAFFLVLLFGELRNRRARGAAAIGAVLALILVPVAPAGVPVLAASSGALIGLFGGARGLGPHAPAEGEP